MVILNIAGLAHWPAPGVKVYNVVPGVLVLMVAGFHVPVIPLVEADGSAGAVEFWQIGPIGKNVGVTLSLTVTVIVVEVAH